MHRGNRAFIRFHGRSVDPTGANSTGGVYRSSVGYSQRLVTVASTENCHFGASFCCALRRLCRRWKALPMRLGADMDLSGAQGAPRACCIDGPVWPPSTSGSTSCANDAAAAVWARRRGFGSGEPMGPHGPSLHKEAWRSTSTSTARACGAPPPSVRARCSPQLQLVDPRPSPAATPPMQWLLLLRLPLPLPLPLALRLRLHLSLPLPLPLSLSPPCSCCPCSSFSY